MTEGAALKEFRKRYWAKLLKRTGYRIGEAARRAGRNRTYTYRILHQLGLI